MARVVLVALVWCAASGEEYAGGAMPQYAAAGGDYAGVAPDYHMNSPDAAAPIDYNQEDVHPPQKNIKDLDDVETWRNPTKSQKRRKSHDEELLGFRGSNEKFEANRHHSRRARKKSEHSRYGEMKGRERSARHGGSGDPAYVDVDDYSNKNIYGDSAKREFRDEPDHIYQRSTKRAKKRKPRDRDFVVVPTDIVELDPEEEVLAVEKKLKEELKNDKEYTIEPRRMASVEEDYEYQHEVRPPPPSESSSARSRAHSDRRRPYHHYNDYYDMKRVYNLRNQLPMMLRRTSTREPARSEVSLRPRLRTEVTVITAPLTATRTSLQVSAARITHEEPPSTDRLLTATRILPTTTTSTTSSTAPATSTSIVTTTTTTDVIATSVSLLPELSQDLSMAEKSKLSIWKKAQKKENAKGMPANKPPVLLQVTNKMQTVVIVEPPATGHDQWGNVRQVSDTPENLLKVKRLMRHKLVAQAKNIHELTDNWDSIVCDYIDPSALNAASPPPRALLTAPFTAIILSSL